MASGASVKILNVVDHRYAAFHDRRPFLAVE